MSMMETSASFPHGMDALKKITDWPMSSLIK